ncbi:MAG: hydroxyethylthiazole kinase [Dysosmobacter welbionis]
MDLARRSERRCCSGPEDLITDGARVWCVTGGSGRMSLVTGTGCMLSVLCGVFATVEPDAAAAAALASAFWKICARRAEHLPQTGQRQFPHGAAGRRQYADGI